MMCLLGIEETYSERSRAHDVLTRCRVNIFQKNSCTWYVYSASSEHNIKKLLQRMCLRTYSQRIRVHDVFTRCMFKWYKRCFFKQHILKYPYMQSTFVDIPPPPTPSPAQNKKSSSCYELFFSYIIGTARSCRDGFLSTNGFFDRVEDELEYSQTVSAHCLQRTGEEADGEEPSEAAA